MNFRLDQLHFSAPTLYIWLGFLLLAAIATYCIIAFRRASRPVRTGLLEALRFLIASFVVILLLKPEWHRTIEPTDNPEIVILTDASGSMATVDTIRNPGSAAPDVVSRSEMAEDVLSSEFYLPLLDDGKTKVSIETFGALRTAEEETEATGDKPSGTNLSQALNDILEDHPDLRSVVMLTDGDSNEGDPPITAAQKYRIRDIPIFTIPFGSDTRLPDLELVSVNAPTYGVIGENVQIPFTVRSSMDRDLRTVVRLTTEDGQEQTKDILIPARETVYDSMLFRLSSEGSNVLTMTLSPASGELLADNNSRQLTITGKPENIRVLVIDTLPRWEYRFIRNALSRDPGVEVDCLLLHPTLGAGNGPDYIQAFPEKLEELQKYDVVFLGDIGVGPEQLTEKQAELLHGLVTELASGLVFIPGSQGHWPSLLESTLGNLIPVELDEKRPEGITDSSPSPLELTSKGRSSLLTMLADTEEKNPAVWSSLPGFFWHAPVIRAKSDTNILAVHANRRNDYGRLPMLVTAQKGRGKVLFLAHDSAWRWRRGVEDLYHYRFWGQVARWMSYQRNLAAEQQLRVYYTPERPKPGNTVTIKANAFDINGAPLKAKELPIELTAPSGKTTRTKLLPSKQGNTLGAAYEVDFEITQAGEWNIGVFLPDQDSAATPQIETIILAQQEKLEKIGQPAQRKSLAEISALSRGKLVEANQLESLLGDLRTLPLPQPKVIPLRIWAHPLAAIIIITLLGLFWVGRKLNGVF